MQWSVFVVVCFSSQINVHAHSGHTSSVTPTLDLVCLSAFPSSGIPQHRRGLAIGRSGVQGGASSDVETESTRELTDTTTGVFSLASR